MLYCTLYIVSVIVLTQLLRYVQRSGRDVFPAVAINYLVAAAFSAVALAIMWSRIEWPRHWPAAGLGAVCGVLYFLHLLLVLAGFRLVGVGVTWAFAALGIVIPVFLSWFAWGENMSNFQWAAMAMLPVAVVLLRPTNGPHRKLTLKGDLILVLVFVMAGAIGTLHKAMEFQAGKAMESPVDKAMAVRAAIPAYQFVLFAVAAATSAGYVHFKRRRYDRPTVALGSAMGLSNALATLFILLGLAAMPATVFYPISSSLVIALSVIVSYLLWRERVTARQVLGLLIAVGVVVLTTR